MFFYPVGPVGPVEPPPPPPPLPQIDKELEIEIIYYIII
jgi:hypothetical protein